MPPAFVPFLTRDLVFLGLTAALALLETWLRDTGWVGVGVGVAAGLAVSYCGFLAHEWGHFLGAFWSGATVRPSPSLLSFFLLRFDTTKSNRRQFLAMSIGGFVATVLAILAIARLVPEGTVFGRTAILLAGAGAGLTAVLEVPVFLRVLRGGELPSSGGVYD
jgi:hypothetical protein